MKLQALLLGSLLAAGTVGEAFAQRSPSRGGGGGSSPSRSGGGSSSGGSSSRGPSYNPSRGGGSSSPSRSTPSRSTPSRSTSTPSRGSSTGGSSSGGSTTRGPSYNPNRGTTTRPSTPSTPSRTTGGSSSGGSTTRGPNYNPNRGTTTRPTTPSTPSRTTGGSSSGGSTTRGPNYNPSRGTTTRPSTPSTPRGPNYNPGRNVPNGPRYGTPSTPGRVVIRGPRYNPAPATARPYRPVVIRHYRAHIPYARPYMNVRRYARPYDYYHAAYRYNIYRYWLFEPVTYGYSNGYYVFNEYPYYVYQGYRHRYSSVDVCSYQLVDSTSNTAIKSFTERVCQAAYDECALERDVANQSLSEVRYFCAERVDDELANISDDSVVFDPQPNPQTDGVWSAINNYLADRSYKEIWRDGYRKERFDPKCTVEKVRKNKLGCKFVVKVAGKNYPDLEGEICSETDSAALAGCDVGTQKKNAGCLLKLAISEGLCH